MNDSYIVRKARKEDIPFIIQTILEAEKSGSDKCGFLRTFNLCYDEAVLLLNNILEEDICGCEFSLSSFMVVEYNSEVIAALGGWMEGDNEDDLPSGIIKANLLGYFLKDESRKKHLFSLNDLISDLEIKREHVYNLEYLYIKPEFRGRGLVNFLLNRHLELAKDKSDRMHLHVFANNVAAIKSYERFGFKIIKTASCNNEKVLNYMPDKTKFLMEFIF